MTTPPLDLPALRDIANAATPGKWAHRILLATKRGAVLSTQDDGGLIPVVSQGINPANSVHIATFDPPTVLALLDRAEAAEKKVARVRQIVDSDGIEVDTRDYGAMLAVNADDISVALEDPALDGTP